ncbi:hypothetical protein AYI68_g8088 [Smittium mucronatum]|uniref:Uncharacterized protein n=1 Tax=Smittium mucronatum TaxID=133383 RepID=A0A1R0GLW6_9FUNG|nr:hypothetical protein AYI68_g8088 [Smittium mucronatum]
MQASFDPAPASSGDFSEFEPNINPKFSLSDKNVSPLCDKDVEILELKNEIAKVFILFLLTFFSPNSCSSSENPYFGVLSADSAKSEIISLRHKQSQLEKECKHDLLYYSILFLFNPLPLFYLSPLLVFSACSQNLLYRNELLTLRSQLSLPVDDLLANPITPTSISRDQNNYLSTTKPRRSASISTNPYRTRPLPHLQFFSSDDPRLGIPISRRRSDTNKFPFI